MTVANMQRSEATRSSGSIEKVVSTATKRMRSVAGGWAATEAVLAAAEAVLKSYRKDLLHSSRREKIPTENWKESGEWRRFPRPQGASDISL